MRLRLARARGGNFREREKKRNREIRQFSAFDGGREKKNYQRLFGKLFPLSNLEPRDQSPFIPPLWYHCFPENGKE